MEHDEDGELDHHGYHPAGKTMNGIGSSSVISFSRVRNISWMLHLVSVTSCLTWRREADFESWWWRWARWRRTPGWTWTPRPSSGSTAPWERRNKKKRQKEEEEVRGRWRNKFSDLTETKTGHIETQPQTRQRNRHGTHAMVQPQALKRETGAGGLAAAGSWGRCKADKHNAMLTSDFSSTPLI